MCINSKSLYDYLIKLEITQKKRLMINILYLRQFYERREIIEILWIKDDKNLADTIIKDKRCDALQRLIDTNRLNLNLKEWVKRRDIDENPFFIATKNTSCIIKITRTT